MLKLYIGRNAGRTVCLTLPVTADETGRAFAELGGASSGEPVLIQEARTSVPYLGGWLKGLSYEKKENRRELDFLAKRIGYLTQAEMLRDILLAELPRCSRWKSREHWGRSSISLTILTSMR